MTTLAAAIMSRDAAPYLADLLKSLKGQVDRVYVGVDGRTTDDTRSVAQKHGAVVFDVDLVRDGVSDFSQGRSQVFAKVEEDWALWIDSDDVLVSSVKLKDVIAEAERDNPKVESIWAPYFYIRDDYGHVNTEFYRERILRMSAHPRWVSRYHETCYTDGGIPALWWEGGLDSSKARWVVDHKHRKRTESGKWDRAYPILLKMVEEDPSDYRAVREVAEAHFASLHWTEAIEWYDRFLKLTADNPGTPLEERWQAVIYTAKAQRSLGDIKGSLLSAERAMSMCPQYADSYFEQEYGYCVLGHWTKAVWWFEQGLNKPAPKGILVTSPGDYNFNPYAFIHTAFWNLKDTDRAIWAVRKALDIQPNNDALLHALKAYVHFQNRRVVVDSTLQSAKYLLANNEPLKAELMLNALPAGTTLEWGDIQPVRDEVNTRLAHLRTDEAYRRFYEEAGTPPDPVKLLKADPYPALAWIERRLRELGAKRVLDVGFGWGYPALYLASKGFQVVGIDIDPARVQYANFAAVRARLVRKSPSALHTTINPHGRYHTWRCAWSTRSLQAWARRRHRARHGGEPTGEEPTLNCSLPEHAHSRWTRGCTICGKRIALPKITKDSKVQFHFASAENIPQRIRDLGPFDAVFASEVLEHVRNPDALVGQLESIAPSVLLTTPDGTAPQEVYPAHVRSYSKDEMEQAFYRRGRLVESHLLAGQMDTIALEYRPGENVLARPTATIFCGGGLEAWNPDQIDTSGLGGSETAVVYLAKELVTKGWRVMVYAEAEGVWDGVYYRHHSKFVAENPVQLFVSWRRPELFDLPIAAQHTALWVHDIDCGDALTEERAKKIGAIWAVSGWHAEHLTAKYPFAVDKVIFVGNGIDPARFDGEEQRDPHRLIYVSSPDRGLERALVFWPLIKKEIPEVTLDIYYGWHNYDALNRDRGFKDWIMDKAKQDGITWHGRIGQKALAKELLRSSALFYPGPHAFEETSCIAALEAQAAGCVPVTRDNGALAETNKRGLLLPNARATVLDYIAALKKASEMSETDRWPMRNWALLQTWPRVVERVLEHLKAEQERVA